MYKIEQSGIYKRWFERLKDANGKARIDVRLRRLAAGNPGDVRPVGRGMSELRIDYGPGYRVYYMLRREMVILLLAGGDKQTQFADIRRALELAAAERNKK